MEMELKNRRSKTGAGDGKSIIIIILAFFAEQSSDRDRRCSERKAGPVLTGDGDSMTEESSYTCDYTVIVSLGTVPQPRTAGNTVG